MEINKLRSEFYKKFPIDIEMGSACFVDSEEGDNDCVWDENNPKACDVANSGVIKDECEYWKQRTTQGFYGSEDIWIWIEGRLDK